MWLDRLSISTLVDVDEWPKSGGGGLGDRTGGNPNSTGAIAPSQPLIHLCHNVLPASLVLARFQGPPLLRLSLALLSSRPFVFSHPPRF